MRFLFRRPRETHIEELKEKIMADLTALNAAIAQLSTDANALVAALSASGGDQAAVDQATASIQAIDQSIQAALPPAPAAPATDANA